MIPAQPDLPRLWRQFDGLERAVIDASAIIYMDKAGFLGLVADAIALVAPQRVLAECGLPQLKIGVFAAKQDTGSADGDVLAVAEEQDLALISDDRRILMQAEEAGVVYFNSLMVLNWLLYRQWVDRDGYRDYYSRLMAIAWYSESVLRFGQQVYDGILKRLRLA